jgi:hypothetical protein
MKRFDQLSSRQQEGAVQLTLQRLLSAIIDGGLRFNDLANGNRLQDRIDRARAAVERQQTPHLLGEAVLRTCRDDLLKLARESAEAAVFVENETVIAMQDLE